MILTCQRRIVAAVLLAWFGFAPNVWGASDLSGVVVAGNLGPVKGAIVGVHRSSADGPLRQTDSHFAFTATDGRFRVAALVDGPYVICVTAPGQALLDPCQWSAPIPVVRLPSSSTVQITLQKGNTIPMRLDDPEHLLPTPNKPRAGVFVQPGVRTTKGVFVAATRVNSDVNGHDFEIVVPSEVSLKFVVDASGVKVIDERGFPVPKGGSLQVVAHEGQSVKTLNFRLAVKPR